MSISCAIVKKYIYIVPRYWIDSKLLSLANLKSRFDSNPMKSITRQSNESIN